ncbi:helix-turn-helix domain-containing protein [Protaetiibacter mangrovi]|uniref:helix-turn-helix domain-containing protein n=1 Tax=Protaetiibacter mangrovi TaxID=2970926 RepID=UPI0011666873|nr:TetR/AcrR family transcriptional regulator [Protaetiibacter mangrovi]TPX03312.1 helix-turn-helix transcriptional regulator [Schumannella luteola]
MGRWAPGSQYRLAAAALDLYLEQGYDDTTVADIAARAGVTERTFYRYFGDKREVLFSGSTALQDAFVTAIAAAPDADSAFAAAARGARAVAGLLDDLEYSRRRGRAIAANDSLRERELLKMATLEDAGAAALRARGVPELAAATIADAAVGAFGRGFEVWLERGGELGEHVDAALGVLAPLAD